MILFPLLLLLAADAPPPPMPPPDAMTKLTLTAPASVPAGSGYVKIVASAPVAWDVEEQWEEDVQPPFEPLDDHTLLVGIPSVGGVIRVSAAAVVDGKPVMAKVYVQVESKVVKPPLKAEAPAARVGHLYCVFVVDAATAPLANSPTLLKSLQGLGDSRTVMSSVTPAVAKYVGDAGGAPCLILLDDDGDVHRAVRMPGTEADIVALIQAAHNGAK